MQLYCELSLVFLLKQFKSCSYVSSLSTKKHIFLENLPRQPPKRCFFEICIQLTCKMLFSPTEIAHYMFSKHIPGKQAERIHFKTPKKHATTFQRYNNFERLTTNQEYYMCSDSKYCTAFSSTCTRWSTHNTAFLFLQVPVHHIYMSTPSTFSRTALSAILQQEDVRNLHQIVRGDRIYIKLRTVWFERLLLKSLGLMGLLNQTCGIFRDFFQGRDFF